MKIIENRDQWTDDFRSRWLEHLTRTGEIDWKLYRYARNRETITTGGIDPKLAKLLLVTTSGAYLNTSQNAFDATNPQGDYTIRTFPVATPFGDLAYAHEHYDHTARKQDPQVNLPLAYLTEMVNAGELGGIADQVVSFSGYQPNVDAVAETMIPEIRKIAAETKAQAALLIPV